MTGNYESCNSDTITFLLDSGASDYIINDDKLFLNFVYLDPLIKISVAKHGVFINATKKGQVNVETDVEV